MSSYHNCNIIQKRRLVYILLLLRYLPYIEQQYPPRLVQTMILKTNN
jgi:hypothetical protein